MSPQEQASYLIERMGGVAAVADKLGATKTAVCNWRKRGVPWKDRPAMARAAIGMGLNLPDNFMGSE